MKRITLALAATALSCLLAANALAASIDNHVWLRAGGAGQNSWAYSCMVAISESIKRIDPGLDIVIQATPGSTTHYGMFAKKILDIGTGYTPTDYWALNGTPPVFKEAFAGKFYNISPMSVSVTHVIVLKDSPIKSLSNLNGKTVYLSDRGSANAQMSINLVDILGIKCKGVQTDRSEGFEMLKEGRVDAIITSNAAPYAYVMELATAADIRFIPFSDEEIAKCIEGGPYCFKGEITDKEYGFVTEPVQVLSQIQNINVRADLEDETVYRLTKAVVEAWPQVVKTVAGAGRVDPLKDVTKTVIKLHPGAIKYYEEKGVVIPADLKP